ncbi:MAG: cofactor assembly of complex C subunit B [Cyanobacteria bacterium P01_H01_bin.15]
MTFNPPVISSTFGLTLLLGIGLFFFIRASIKDRTESLTLVSELEAIPFLEALQAYLEQRTYRIAGGNAETGELRYVGQVRPSVVLAILLTALAAFGLVCLGLVLSYVFPQLNGLPVVLGLGAPAAGWFYWRGAGREEQVKLWLTEGLSDRPTQVIVSAHRDELLALQRSLTVPYRVETSE